MADKAGLIRGRIPPEEMFPAGDARFRTSYIDLDIGGSNVTLRVIECGDATAMKVAFCVHGWGCSVYSYRRLMPVLAQAGMRAVAVDLPGHGLSDKPGDPTLYTLDAQTECVLQAMRKLDISRAILVGHSMGGPICARAAVLSPDSVVALALLAPAGFGTEWELRILRAVTPRFVAPLLPRILHRWMFALVLNAVYGSRYRPTSTDVDEYWAPTQFPRYVRAMWDLLHHFEWNAGIDCGFASIAVPTAILDGRRDNLLVRKWVRRYVEVLPHAVLGIIDHCGHVVPEEAPEVVAEAIGALIR